MCNLARDGTGIHNSWNDWMIWMGVWVCLPICVFSSDLIYFVFSILEALMFKSLTKATANARHETHHAEACIPATQKDDLQKKSCGSMAADWMFPSVLDIWIIWSSWLGHNRVVTSYAPYQVKSLWSIGWVPVDGVQRVDGTDQKNDVQPEKRGTGQILLWINMTNSFCAPVCNFMQFPWKKSDSCYTLRSTTCEEKRCCSTWWDGKYVQDYANQLGSFAERI